jgi:thiamine biosynthesis lipoprotein
MRRRKFISCWLGAAALGAVGLQLGNRAWSKRVAGLAKISRSGRALGTNVLITVFHHDRARADEAISRAFAAIDQGEQTMSLYRADSQICRLNRLGRLDDPDPDLVRVLERAAELSALSEGAFDVSVQPLWLAYQEAQQRGTLPSAAAIQAAQQYIDWQKISVSRESIRFTSPGMAITLNGIAQGLVADAARQALQDHGIEHALIDSGEIAALGPHVDKSHWSIGLKDPRDPAGLLGLAALEGRCLATSGDYETAFSADFSQHHLLDPRTGRSPDDLSSVSVVAPTALEADALSTAVFLMGRERGQALVESLPRVDALFVDKHQHLSRTSGFPLS